MHESVGKNYKVLTEDRDRIHELETKLTEAKEIIDCLLNLESMAQERGMCISDELRNKVNEFLEETK